MILEFDEETIKDILIQDLGLKKADVKKVWILNNKVYLHKQI